MYKDLFVNVEKKNIENTRDFFDKEKFGGYGRATYIRFRFCYIITNDLLYVLRKNIFSVAKMIFGILPQKIGKPV